MIEEEIVFEGATGDATFIVKANLLDDCHAFASSRAAVYGCCFADCESTQGVLKSLNITKAFTVPPIVIPSLILSQVLAACTEPSTGKNNGKNSQRWLCWCSHILHYLKRVGDDQRRCDLDPSKQWYQYQPDSFGCDRNLSWAILPLNIVKAI